MIRVGVVLGLIFICALPAGASDEKVLAGVAANFMMPFQEMAAAFEKESGIHVESVFPSTGKLYAQIRNGAPYDIFLAADEERPELLFRDGLSGKPFVYAMGEVVLWSADRDFCARFADWEEAVRSNEVKRLAIANPESAPYGAAAVSALKASGLFDSLQAKYVFPQDIGQTFQYASTGAVQAGFCALSSAVTDQGKEGCYYTITQAPKVTQAACVLTRTNNREAAEKFAAFLLTPAGIQIKEKYGYR